MRVILQRYIAPDVPHLHSADRQVGEVVASLTAGTVECQPGPPLPRIHEGGEGCAGGLGPDDRCPSEKRGGRWTMRRIGDVGEKKDAAVLFIGVEARGYNCTNVQVHNHWQHRKSIHFPKVTILFPFTN